ncbi:hypothetical protein [Streptomyces bauhiniae]|uniref:DeoR family transcriptional regulator n=1 Tax=Streptomyces bauhiniae TaxID=2340725 RepID=A0A7K3QR89_9ACTN|nr:hypothetical protein [Streptomyces bauhiniae]NEB92392.1 hypothetical protein [Streptomyces bauhiniae]
MQAIRRHSGPIRTGEVMALYRAHGWGPSRATARKDLQYLARRGRLTEDGAINNRSYGLPKGTS